MPAGDRAECDLVMKGGITSGVVYPGAVLELSKRYRFRNVGGTSAGAIAAGVTAAAEYGRQRAGGDRLPGLEQAAEDLATPGFLRGLFQPVPDGEVAFNMLLALVKAGRGRLGRAAGALAALLKGCPVAPVTALVLWVALVTLAFTGGPDLDGAGGWVLAIAGGIALTALLALLGVLGAAVVAVRRTGRALRANGFGLCPGVRQEGRPEALTEWLHRTIQACAGLGEDDPPLTLGQLEEKGVDVRLEVMSTDLSLARPVRLSSEPSDYLFEAGDMRALFPEPVVSHMLGGGDERLTQPLPGKELPVVVAVRMSLSFPLLLSAVRLYSQHPNRDEVMENWLSDGGISSNFPIHFFDSWFPSRPTFGFDLQPFPAEGLQPGAPDVFVPGEDERPLPHWTGVEGAGRFVHQILDVMQNWRDTLQSELPGFRDRICQVRLHEGEGALNLDMEADTIKHLTQRGREAAAEIERKFDWRRHRFVRYLTLMELLEIDLHDTDTKFGAFEPDLASGMPGVDVCRHPDAWYPKAAAATAALMSVARPWGPPPAEVGFDIGVEPTPTPVMRVTPKA